MRPVCFKIIRQQNQLKQYFNYVFPVGSYIETILNSFKYSKQKLNLCNILKCLLFCQYRYWHICPKQLTTSWSSDFSMLNNKKKRVEKLTLSPMKLPRRTEHISEFKLLCITILPKPTKKGTMMDINYPHVFYLCVFIYLSSMELKCQSPIPTQSSLVWFKDT